jgi:hypothetical protein
MTRLVVTTLGPRGYVISVPVFVSQKFQARDENLTSGRKVQLGGIGCCSRQ